MTHQWHLVNKDVKMATLNIIKDSSLSFLKTESHNIAQVGLELAILSCMLEL
jgi:hypothetical protein